MYHFLFSGFKNWGTRFVPNDFIEIDKYPRLMSMNIKDKFCYERGQRLVEENKPKKTKKQKKKSRKSKNKKKEFFKQGWKSCLILMSGSFVNITSEHQDIKWLSSQHKQSDYWTN